MRYAMAASALIVFGTYSAAEEPFTEDSLETVKDQLEEKNAVLVDVREQKEWDAGHIAGAVLMPLSELAKTDRAKELTKKVDKAAILYIHCARGQRAKIAAGVLKEYGFDVRPLKPGYSELVESGFEKAK